MLSEQGLCTRTMMKTCWKCERMALGVKGWAPGSWNTIVTMSFPMCRFLSSWWLKNKARISGSLQTFNVDVTQIHVLNKKSSVFWSKPCGLNFPSSPAVCCWACTAAGSTRGTWARSPWKLCTRSGFQSSRLREKKVVRLASSVRVSA